MNLSVLILSCDKNIDLSPFVLKTIKKFSEISIECFVVTETNHDCYKNVNSIALNSNFFGERMNYALKQISSEYVLILLDDYFVLDNMLFEKIKIWNNELSNNLVALRLSKNKYLYKKIRKTKKLKLYKKMEPYDIDFHPTIWKKSYLLDITNKCLALNAWQIEPRFYESLQLDSQQCAISRCYLNFVELVVRGFFFRKPYFKYCKKMYHGERKILSIFHQIKFSLKSFCYHLLPKKVVRLFKKVFRLDSFSK